MVSDVEHRDIFRDILLTDDSDLRSRKPLDQPEHKLNDMKRAFITKFRVFLADEPFHNEDRDGENQKSHHREQDKDQTNHVSSVSVRNPPHKVIW